MSMVLDETDVQSAESKLIASIIESRVSHRKIFVMMLTMAIPTRVRIVTIFAANYNRKWDRAPDKKDE